MGKEENYKKLEKNYLVNISQPFFKSKNKEDLLFLLVNFVPLLSVVISELLS